MIRIVDYGLGNVRAFQNVYHRQNIRVETARTAVDLDDDVEKLILPGVGSFDEAMGLLAASGMLPRLRELVEERGVPVLGICVGMQMLGDGSDEGAMPGLGWVPGRVRKFDLATMGEGALLPHMGWNDVTPTERGEALFGGMADPRFYFLHSYYFDCASEDDVAAMADYGDRFACAVRRGNVWGVQFHPEKSHRFGETLLRQFAELPAC